MSGAWGGGNCGEWGTKERGGGGRGSNEVDRWGVAGGGVGEREGG